MTRTAFTLIEVLVALVLTSLVLGLAMGTGIAVRRTQGALDLRADDTARTTAVPRMLAWAVGRTGRGVAACSVDVTVSGATWRGTAVDFGATVATTVEVLAGRDGAGRPALFHRTMPWVRQPWMEDVVSFTVLDARDDTGAWRRLAPDGTTRWRAVRIELTWSDGDVRVFDVALPHAPCAVAP